VGPTSLTPFHKTHSTNPFTLFLSLSHSLSPTTLRRKAWLLCEARRRFTTGDMMSSSGAGRYMAFPPSPSAPPSPHLSALRSSALAEQDKYIYIYIYICTSCLLLSLCMCVCGLLGSSDWLLLVVFDLKNSADQIVTSVFISLFKWFGLRVRVFWRGGTGDRVLVLVLFIGDGQRGVALC